MESEPTLTPREKNPLYRKKISPEEDRTHDAASSRTASPTHYQLSYSGLPSILSILLPPPSQQGQPPCSQQNKTTSIPFSHYTSRYRLVGLVVKASASRAEDPGFESRLRRDFSGVESYQWHPSGYHAGCLAL